MVVPAKILIVEDEPISQRVAKLAIENMGYQVDIASSGRDALTLFQLKHYDAILMDFGLPDMTGDQVTQKIRELEEQQKRVPIIALTAHVFHEDKKRCLEAGMDDFLGKPLDFKALETKLAEWTTKTK